MWGEGGREARGVDALLLHCITRPYSLYTGMQTHKHLVNPFNSLHCLDLLLRWVESVCGGGGGGGVEEVGVWYMYICRLYNTSTFLTCRHTTLYNH